MCLQIFLDAKLPELEDRCPDKDRAELVKRLKQQWKVVFGPYHIKFGGLFMHRLENPFSMLQLMARTCLMKKPKSSASGRSWPWSSTTDSVWTTTSA